MIRYEIEKELIKGTIEVDDIKNLWNQKYSDYLGLEVPSDKEGVLQDVHWAHGSFGYFPTYTLGSLMAAQIMQQLESEHSNISMALRQKEFSVIRDWLEQNIWKWGRSFDLHSLCQRMTGKELEVSPFLSYSRQKFGAIYHIK
jgi:carboxypeptidase Taq